MDGELLPDTSANTPLWKGQSENDGSLEASQPRLMVCATIITRYGKVYV